MQTLTDLKLINKRKQAKRILTGKYRKGINYLRLMDIIKEISDQLYTNSLNRVSPHNKINV